MDGCYACSIRCKKRVKYEQPYKVDPKFGGPEYETIGAMGTNSRWTTRGALPEHEPARQRAWHRYHLDLAW
jgi:aldehyde:ferredoxin oxidoreductase